MGCKCSASSFRFGVPLGALLVSGAAASAADVSPALCADRAAVEGVYHSHRLGTKQPFEQELPSNLIEQMVRLDLRKEAVLRKVYGVVITPSMVAAEVRRILTTTRAPKILAEIQHALGDNAERFALTVALPIIVERELRHRFDNDASLHASQRREAEQAREKLLSHKAVENMQDTTWQLTPRPGEDPAVAPSPTQAHAKSSAYTIEATAQVSQVIAAPDRAASGNKKHYFQDLDPELQNVLRVQLQKPGDVSAVIETPGGFLVFLAKGREAETLTAASVSIPKRGYEEWLGQQSTQKR